MKHRHGAVYRINIWVTISPHGNIVVMHTTFLMTGATRTSRSRSRTRSAAA